MVDQLPKYGLVHIKVYCLCMAIFIESLSRFPSTYPIIAVASNLDYMFLTVNFCSLYRKCQLSALMEDPANGFDILYEIESGTPSETWPFNCESSFTARNSLFRKKLESKSFSCRAKQLEMKEALNEWYDSFKNENYVDADEPHETDVDGCTEFENDDRDIVTLADFCISKKKTVKRKRPTASSKCSFDELKPCNPASTELVYLHGKNTMVYIESDGMAPPIFKEGMN